MSNSVYPDNVTFDTDGEVLLPCVVVDPNAYYPPFDEMSLAEQPSGKTIMYSTPSGTDDGSAFAAAFGCMTDPGWKNILWEAPEPKADSKGNVYPPDEIIFLDGNGDLSEGEMAKLNDAVRGERVIVIGDCHVGSVMRSKLAMMGAVVLGISNTNALGLSASIAKSMEAFSFSNQFPVEFRFTDLHYQLSHQATMLKDKRQQQSRKAHFLMHEKKRVARGRSHAKQKHKGTKRYA